MEVCNEGTNHIVSCSVVVPNYGPTNKLPCEAPDAICTTPLVKEEPVNEVYLTDGSLGEHVEKLSEERVE